MNINIEIEELNEIEMYNKNSDSDNETENENKNKNSTDKNEFATFDEFFLQDCEDTAGNLLYVKKLDYMENYRVEDLKKIAKFYEIPVQRKKKEDMVEEIIVYEDCLENLEKVQRRMLYWGYLEELKADPYFKQFVIF